MHKHEEFPIGKIEHGNDKNKSLMVLCLMYHATEHMGQVYPPPTAVLSGVSPFV